MFIRSHGQTDGHLIRSAKGQWSVYKKSTLLGHKRNLRIKRVAYSKGGLVR